MPRHRARRSSRFRLVSREVACLDCSGPRGCGSPLGLSLRPAGYGSRPQRGPLPLPFPPPVRSPLASFASFISLHLSPSSSLSYLPAFSFSPNIFTSLLSYLCALPNPAPFAYSLFSGFTSASLRRRGGVSLPLLASRLNCPRSFVVVYS